MSLQDPDSESTAPAWRQLVMNLGDLDSEVVEAVFLECGATSISFADSGDEPVLEPGPGETPLWSQTTITGMFAPDVDLGDLERELLSALQIGKLPDIRIEDLEDRDWEREWLKDFRPLCFGQRLWIYPTGFTPPGEDEVVVYLDPGLAFGTGTHATTALCLEWLDSLQISDKSILDFGCGSGVLAIAALRLGCSSAIATDIDPQALLATRRNAERNEVADKLFIEANAESIEGEFDLVVANILAEPLIQLAKTISSHLRPRGMLALSGVLCDQADDVMATYSHWIEFDEPVFRKQDDQIWSCLTGKRRAV